MRRSISAICQDLATFSPVEGDWRPLQVLLDELWSEQTPQHAISELLGLFERYPEEDGAGVFWSILGGLESLPGHESQLLASARRAPSGMGVTMIGRLSNAGVESVDGVSLIQILTECASQPFSEAARGRAASFLKGGR